MASRDFFKYLLSLRKYLREKKRDFLSCTYVFQLIVPAGLKIVKKKFWILPFREELFRSSAGVLNRALECLFFDFVRFPLLFYILSWRK